MAAAVPPRAQLVQLIAGMLTKKGPAMVSELERRVAKGEGLQVRNVNVDAGMLQEALAHHRASQPTASSSSAAPAPKAPSQVSPKRPPPTAAGARWMPGAPSASLLAARALSECEHAEVFSRSVRVLGGGAAVFSRPDVLSDPTGEALADGDVREVVARYASPRDGRVYLRLKSQSPGWVSTRCSQCLATVVLAELEGESPPEPARCQEPVESTAAKLLPPVEAAAATGDRAGLRLAPGAPAEADDEEAGGGGGGAEGRGEEDELCQEEGEEEEDADGEEELGSEEEEEDEEDADGVGNEELAPGDAAGRAKKVRKFRVLVGRCPVLISPGAAQLFAPSQPALQHKQEFLADGVVFVPAEGRAYLRLTRGRGWVSERSRTDLRKMAVVPVTRRRQPLSKKMARAVAFRGGDVDGATRLRKEDLVKNSQGKIVSKKASEAAKKRFQNPDSSVNRWGQAVKRAKAELGLAGFVAVKKGSPCYEKAREYFEAAKRQKTTA